MKNLKIKALGLFILSSCPLLSFTNLDNQMSLIDKEQTGVVNLSLKQREALGAWIDKHYVPIGKQPAAPSSTEEAQASSLTIAGNVQGGDIITLSNGTMYAIHPSDTSISSVWVAPSPITIEEGQDEQYPIILKNEATQERVRAKLQNSP